MVRMLTKTEGKITAFARSSKKSKKRFGGGVLDLFSSIKAHVTPPKGSSTLWTLEMAELKNQHLGFRENLIAWAHANYLAECLWGFLGDHDPHPEIFSWWEKSKAFLVSSNEVNVFLEWDFLKLCGIEPQIHACVNCHRNIQNDARAFFLYDRGGVECGTCQKNAFGEWFDPGWFKDLNVKNEKQVLKILHKYISHTLGKTIQSQTFWQEMVHDQNTGTIFKTA